MKRSVRVILLSSLLGLVAGGCDQLSGSSLRVERLPEVQPSLPAVPRIPPPPFPVTYPDGTYSVFGVRRRSATTLDHDASVTGYIVEIYQPPACPEGETCPRPAAPHFFLADTANEGDAAKRLLVAGYAQSDEELRELIRRGSRRDPGPDGTVPPAIDFTVGNKVKVTGRFATMSSVGFNASNGLLEYSTHQTLEAAAQ